MVSMDLVVEGECYLSGRFEQACIGIQGGRIAALARRLDGDRRLDFGSLKIIPAAIDSHVHFREPGMTHKEDFRTGSVAALHGGVTCVLDMPNTVPPTDSVSSIKEKAATAASRSVVDFGLFAAVRPGVDVDALASRAAGFKLYMAGTTGDLLVPSLSAVEPELAAVARSGKVLAVHAEDESLRRKEPAKSLHDHLRNRNGECEASAIRKVAKAADGCRLHICHVSSKDSLPLLGSRPDMTAELTPHHMLLDRDRPLGTSGKVNPPLRTRGDRQALFLAFKNGHFDTMASDHAPHTVEEKNEEFDFAPSGMPGVETMLPVMLHLVRERHLALSTVLNALCERPGEIFGIRKGRIEVGYDADLLVVDFSDGRDIRADRLHSKCGWTAYEGMTGVFPRTVMVRGEVMVNDGEQAGDSLGRDVVVHGR
jgi:dihydroorotase